MQERCAREKRDEECARFAELDGKASPAKNDKNDNNFTSTVQAGSTFERAHPIPDSECEKVLNELKEEGGANVTHYCLGKG